MTESKKIAVIAGAGPAGLTAALELLRRSDVTPIVLEADGQVGGISKTINFRGNRMDLGGHRFFSKSDWVMKWWQDILPVAQGSARSDKTLQINYQNQSHKFLPESHAPASADAVMLVRQRLSRIFYRRRFFDYPLRLTARTVKNMGIIETLRVGFSYGRAQLARKAPETTLEEFFINRFGDRLYRTFFKDYTEKVWGVPCREISSEWGAQRIKGLSVGKALAHAVAGPFRRPGYNTQKGVETSLIEHFLYPKFGPGQMWEEVARRVGAAGGTIRLNHRIVGLESVDDCVKKAIVLDTRTGSVEHIPCDHFLSTMPVQNLVAFLRPADARITRIADGLPYRDFMTAGLLVRKMHSSDRPQDKVPANGMPPDNWIYIQEPDVKLGRVQIFNNWSPAMVADPDTIWLGLEYFCREDDELWTLADAAFLDYAAGELEKIGMIDRHDVIDGTVVRVPKAYPAYFGPYREFGAVREYLDTFGNLYPIGRNGMHRYNNQDHSMLAAKGAVQAITQGGWGKAAIWAVNDNDEYHEEVARID